MRFNPNKNETPVSCRDVDNKNRLSWRQLWFPVTRGTALQWQWTGNCINPRRKHITATSLSDCECVLVGDVELAPTQRYGVIKIRACRVCVECYLSVAVNLSGSKGISGRSPTRSQLTGIPVALDTYLPGIPSVTRWHHVGTTCGRL